MRSAFLSRSLWRGSVVGLLLVFVLAPVLQGQQTSGTIYGTVKDPQGAVVVGAKVTVANRERAITVETVTTGEGGFVLPSLQAGTYDLTVEMAGFKKYERKDIILRVNDRLALGDIALELGATAETVTVEAEVATLQTASAERSGIVTGTQTVNLALNGRNYLDLIKTVPGIVSNFNGQVAGPGGIGDIYANGQRGNENNLTLDGVTNMDTGSNGTQHTSLNIDAVAEFRVITNSQPAEFGRSSGAAINIVSKSGSTDFHGTGYWFHRHDDLNANNWRNNKDGQPRKFYRYNYEGYNIGGPVYIPGKFNKNKDKLFFFFGQEWQKQLIPNGTRFVTVPTAAERGGDFSLTHDSAGVIQIINDPLDNHRPFQGNKIPQSRFNADGVKILNFYPLPNTPGFPDYNYQSQVSSSYPRRQEIYRIDWNINEKWRAFFRVINDKDLQIMPYGQWSANYNIPFGPMAFGQPGHSAIANLTTVINPTLTNEFIFGPSRNHLTIDPVNDAFSKAKLGLSFKPIYGDADPLGLVPNFLFDGVPNAPSTGFNGTPFRNVNNTFDFSDNLNKVFAVHHVKVGFYIQRSRKDQTAFTPANGTIQFGRDAANPGDTNWAFSNALLGNFRTYQQANHILNGLYRYTNAEWYIQDNWKLRPGLTLDYGIRFYIVQPQYDAALQTASFNPALYDPKNAVVLLQRAIDPSTGRVAAFNPTTGTYGPQALIGSLAPGVGDRANGMARAGLNKYPRGLIDSRGVHYAPRVGAAWDPWGKGTTVVRIGAGVFYDRFQGNPVFDQLPNPPSTDVPTIYYGNISTAASLPGIFFPPDVRGFSRDGHVPTTYNYNASVQRKLPRQFVLDAGYAGSVSRHLLNRYDFNIVPFGSAWLPQNQDPTVTPKFDGTTTLPVNFYKPYIGYGSADITAFGATSNYNSLQVALNRRVAQGFQFGLAYTFSKALGTASGDGSRFHPFDARKANYGPLDFDRAHVLVFNYIYDVPKLAKNNLLDNPVGRAVFNNWQVSGITSFVSGSPTGIGYSVQGVSDLSRRITGSENWGPRVVITGNPTLDKGSKAIDRFINTAAFAPAPKGSVGIDSGVNYLRNPGINNWDISVFKNFPLWGPELTRYLQVRCEMFNAWNHTQFSGFNGSVQFDRNLNSNTVSNGNITNLPTSRGGGGGTYGFGAITGARDPRIIQLAAKIYF